MYIKADRGISKFVLKTTISRCGFKLISLGYVWFQENMREKKSRGKV